jgi:ribonuclease HI
MIEYYTDGACSVSTGVGAFAVVEVWNNEIDIMHHCETAVGTTNNREEMKAILYVMKNFGHDNPNVYSDSSYAINTFNEWMFNWARNDWRKADNSVPENLDIIKEYYDLYQKGYRIQLYKVPGHSGHVWNELADKLATGMKGVGVPNGK